MIAITQKEAFALRENFGDTLSISITNRQKRGGRKKYYTEESRRVITFLNKFRKGDAGAKVNKDKRKEIKDERSLRA